MTTKKLRNLANGAKKRQEIYAFLVRYMTGTGGAPPTVRQVQRAVSLKTPSTAAYHLAQLHEMGVIRLVGEARARRIQIVGATWIVPDIELAKYIIKQDYIRRVQEATPAKEPACRSKDSTTCSTFRVMVGGFYPWRARFGMSPPVA